MKEIKTKADLDRANNRIEAIEFLLRLDDADDNMDFAELDALEVEMTQYIDALQVAYKVARKRELGLKLIKGGLANETTGN